MLCSELTLSKWQQLQFLSCCCCCCHHLNHKSTPPPSKASFFTIAWIGLDCHKKFKSEDFHCLFLQKSILSKMAMSTTVVIWWPNSQSKRWPSKIKDIWYHWQNWQSLNQDVITQHWQRNAGGLLSSSYYRAGSKSTCERGDGPQLLEDRTAATIPLSSATNRGRGGHWRKICMNLNQSMTVWHLSRLL